MVGLYVALSQLAARSRAVSCILEGEAVTWFDHGDIDHPTRKAYMMSGNDLKAAFRREGVDGKDGLENVKAIRLETSGVVSVIKREPCKPELA